MTVEALDSASPRSRQKNEAILEAATRVFLRAGYANASMDAIAGEAGVSKTTIYSHFGSKEALFGAIIEQRCRRRLAAVAAGPEAASEPRAALTAVAEQIMEATVAPDSLALYRVIIAEAPRFPDLGRITHLHGARAAIQSLARYLADQSARGRLAVDDPELAAEQFFGIVMGFFQLRALLGVETRPAPDRAARHIRRAVDTFLIAYRAD